MTDEGWGIILIIIAVIIFVCWIEWIIGKAIGKHVSHTTGIVVGIVLILLGFGLLVGIACIVYSQKNKNPPVDINANINVSRQPLMQQTSNQQQFNDDDTMACPYCAETIKKKAKICRYCNNKLV
jgi:hypothetical protein